MYKKHHWQTWGPTFYQLHLLFDKHYAEQAELVDKLAERVQTLGGVAIAMAHDIAELSEIERPPRGREEVPVQVSRLLEAHEHILIRSRAAARRAAERGDDGTNDLYVSDILRTNEMQVWFLAEHLENPAAADAARVALTVFHSGSRAPERVPMSIKSGGNLPMLVIDDERDRSTAER